MVKDIGSDRLVTYDKNVIFSVCRDYEFNHLKSQRDAFARKFARHINLLLEAKKPRRVYSSKGLLDPRKVYKHSFDDSIFYKSTSQKTSDTTIVFLIDGSGSMESNAFNGMSRMDICNVLASAFAKAVKMTVGKEINLEVFVKSSAGIVHKATTGTDNGAFANLTRIFTNTNQRSMDFDSVLKASTIMPFTIDGGTQGSYTAELSVMPALVEWRRKNIVTKNVVLLNITDGEAYAPLNGYTFGDTENRQMRMKYLRGMPHLNIMISGRYAEDSLRNIYGDNLMCVENESFHAELFKKLSRILEDVL